MALSSPLGKCHFRRSSLKSPNGTFDAEDPLHFYSTMLIETIWNREAHHGSKECNSPTGHPHRRSDYKIVYGGGGWQTHYGNWSHLPLTYGDYKQPSRLVKQGICAWYMAVPMPTREEDWVFIDRLACIRAIYIPVAHEANEKYSSLCTYLTVRFNNLDPFKLEYHKDRTPETDAKMFDFTEVVDVSSTTLTPQVTFGLVPDEKTALGINITRLVANLIIPEDYRKRDVFEAKGLILVDSSLIPVVPVQQVFTHTCMMDWAKIAGANHGLSLAWTKGDHSLPWFVSWMKNSFIFAIGWVPGIGPFLAAGSAVLFAAIEDPDTVMDTLRAVMPTTELIENVVAEIKNCVAITQDSLVDGVKLKAVPSLPAEESKPASGDVAATAREMDTAAQDKADKPEVITASSYKAITAKEYEQMVQDYIERDVKSRRGGSGEGLIIVLGDGGPAGPMDPDSEPSQEELDLAREMAEIYVEAMLNDKYNSNQWKRLPDNDYSVGKTLVEKLKSGGA